MGGPGGGGFGICVGGIDVSRTCQSLSNSLHESTLLARASLGGGGFALATIGQSSSG